MIVEIVVTLVILAVGAGFFGALFAEGTPKCDDPRGHFWNYGGKGGGGWGVVRCTRCDYSDIY